MKKIILFILVCSLLFSCEDMETVVTIDIPPHEPVLVLNSIIDTDTEVRVLVSHSVGAFEQNIPSLLLKSGNVQNPTCDSPTDIKPFPCC